MFVFLKYLLKIFNILILFWVFIMAFPGILVSFYKLKHPNRLKIVIKAFFVGIGAYFNSTVFLFFLNPKDINISDIGIDL